MSWWEWTWYWTSFHSLSKSQRKPVILSRSALGSCVCMACCDTWERILSKWGAASKHPNTFDTFFGLWHLKNKAMSMPQHSFWRCNVVWVVTKKWLFFSGRLVWRFFSAMHSPRLRKKKQKWQKLCRLIFLCPCNHLETPQIHLRTFEEALNHSLRNAPIVCSCAIQMKQETGTSDMWTTLLCLPLSTLSSIISFPLFPPRAVW